MYIYICRHGETNWSNIGRLQGREKIPLCKEGRRTAHEISGYFKSNNISVDYVISSPLERAAETSSILSKELKIPYFREILLQERDFGVLTGKLFCEVREKVISQNTEGFERDNLLSTRVKSFWDKLVNYTDFEKYSIVIVTHSLVINMLLSQFGYQYDLEDSKGNHKKIIKAKVDRGKIKRIDFISIDDS